jgi:hypothetical protein
VVERNCTRRGCIGVRSSTDLRKPLLSTSARTRAPTSGSSSGWNLLTLRHSPSSLMPRSLRASTWPSRVIAETRRGGIRRTGAGRPGG